MKDSDPHLLDRYPVIPVIEIEDETDAVPLAEALLAGGLGVIEVTFRTAAAAGAIRAISQNLPEMVVGAGTVVTPDQARAALDTGATFGLAPGLDQEIIDIFRAVGRPFVPGVYTPTEVQAAFRAGCDRLKFFPAGSAGGPKALQSLSAPFKSLGIRFCPTGGVKLDNMGDYYQIEAVFAVGGSWLATREQIRNKDFQGVTARARIALETAIGAGRL